MAQNMMTMNRDDLLELKKRMENALDNDLLEDESFDINEFGIFSKCPPKIKWHMK